MEKWSVDRIEGDLAVLMNDEKRTQNVPLSKFPGKISAGDIVFEQSDGSFQVDAAVTAEKKKNMFDLQKKIFSD